MATITFNYNAQNSQAQNLVNYILSTGFLTPVDEKKSNFTLLVHPENPKSKPLFADTFGMWADRNIDIKQIRQERRQRRIKNYDNASL